MFGNYAISHVEDENTIDLIDEKTIGQLVEREVYEGDILSDGEIKWLVKYDNKNHYFVAIEQNKLKEEWCIHHLLRGYNQGKAGKVIGNIYDNPELLEINK